MRRYSSGSSRDACLTPSQRPAVHAQIVAGTRPRRRPRAGTQPSAADRDQKTPKPADLSVLGLRPSNDLIQRGLSGPEGGWIHEGSEKLLDWNNNRGPFAPQRGPFGRTCHEPSSRIHTGCVTPSLRICWRAAPTGARSRSFWDQLAVDDARVQPRRRQAPAPRVRPRAPAVLTLRNRFCCLPQ
jgi:hypothetical protein